MTIANILKFQCRFKIHNTEQKVIFENILAQKYNYNTEICEIAKSAENCKCDFQS